MNDPLLLWFSLVIAVALLVVLAVHTPSTFLLDLIRRLFYHGHFINR
jgi:hypothetical protein